MPNLILINATQRKSSSSTVDFSPAKQFALDINQIISPIRLSADGSYCYFTTRELSGMDTSSRNLAQINFRASDSLTTIAGQSDGLVVLNVVTRRGVDMKSEPMVFVTAKIKESLDIVATGTRFYYMEEGDPSAVEYIVSQSPATIVSSGSSPVFNMNGRDLYVNDIVGNDATAEKGNPLLPWLTVDAAIAAATTFGDTVVILEGTHTASNNLYKAGVNVEVRTNANLTITTYAAAGFGNQTIYGGGTIFLGASGFAIGSTFSGTVKVDVGKAVFNGVSGAGSNQSTVGGVFDFNADYVTFGAATTNYFVCSGNGTFNWRVKIKQTDSSTQYKSGFLIQASSPNANPKTFEIKIANGTSNASNEGFLLLNAIDTTYTILLDSGIVFTGSAGSPCFDAVLSALACTGGQVTVRGVYSIVSGRMYIGANSTLRIHDYSVTYASSTNAKSMIAIAGGNSTYNFYGRKKTYSSAESIALGTFAGANNSVNFGAISATAGTDCINFKGGMQCAYTSAPTAKGIVVTNGAAGLIIDGGSIEMVNSALQDAISSATPQNIKVYGTGFVKGAVNVNITNVITGSSIISDANVTVNM